MLLRLIIIITGGMLISSCGEKVKKEELRVIDDIQLGTTLNQLYSQFDSLNFSPRNFYTNILITSVNEIKNYELRIHATDIFNLSPYKTEAINHYGIFYPTLTSGSKNVVGLTVLLVHTNPVLLLSDDGFTQLTKETGVPGISQDISISLMKDIELMLRKKYGQPISSENTLYNTIYIIEGNQIRDYVDNESSSNEYLFWKTKYYTVKFFKGMKSKASKYNIKDQVYITTYFKDPSLSINYEEGESQCQSYCFISYELTAEAIKLLGLGDPKL